MQLTKTSLIAAILAISMHSVSATISVADIAYASGGGQPSPVCSPACRVYVDDEFGCTGSADFAGACQQQKGDVTMGIDGEGCDGMNVEWSVSGDSGSGVIFVNAPTGNLGVNVHDCKVPESVGQCVYRGGCTVDN